MNIEFNATLAVYGIIFLISSAIVYELYKTVDGRLRILLIALFACKAFLNLGDIIYTFLRHNGYLKDLSFIWMLSLNLPMAVVMVMLYNFVKKK